MERQAARPIRPAARGSTLAEQAGGRREAALDRPATRPFRPAARTQTLAAQTGVRGATQRSAVADQADRATRTAEALGR